MVETSGSVIHLKTVSQSKPGFVTTLNPADSSYAQQQMKTSPYHFKSSIVMRIEEALFYLHFEKINIILGRDLKVLLKRFHESE